MSSLPRFFYVSSFVGLSLLGSSQIAVAQEAQAATPPARPGIGAAAPSASAELPEAAKSPEAASPAQSEAAFEKASATFVSDGRPMSLEGLGVTISPPATWEVSTNTGTLSVVMREPRIEAPDYEKAKYQRNITVAAIHTASPIDEKRATELKAELTKNFSADGLVADFQIVEHKFFNYRGQNDGLLVYSSLSIGEYPMMQMHILVSGQAKQFLLSYTDLAERFSDQKDGGFEAAWNTMVSVDVTGATPSRESEYLRYGIAAIGFMLVGLTLLLLRRKARKHDFSGEADELLESGEAPSTSTFGTLAGGWRLDGKDGDSETGIEFSRHASRTRKTEYVSNY